MTSMVIMDSTLESVTLSVNTPLVWDNKQICIKLPFVGAFYGINITHCFLPFIFRIIHNKYLLGIIEGVKTLVDDGLFARCKNWASLFILLFFM
jgi:hypothetical protein